MLIEDLEFGIYENGNLIPIEDPNETNKVATNIPSNNSENNSDKSFRYQDPTKSKTFVYQDGKENDHNISQNSNEYIDDLSPTPSEKEAQQSLNTTSTYSQQSTPYINEQQTNSFNYPETYNYPSDIPQQFETQVHQTINVPPTYQQNTQTPLPTMYTQQNHPHLNGQQFYPSHQNAVEHEKYKHHFEPITLDDCTFCITYVAKFKIDSNQRLTFKNYSELAQELMCTQKKIPLILPGYI